MVVTSSLSSRSPKKSRLRHTKRRSLTGTRYKGGGVTLEIGRAGLTRLRHAKRPVTACEQA